MRKKICHIITGLNTGGAEMMLYKLLSCMDRMAFEIEVISLMDIGPIGENIHMLEIPVRALGMRRGVPNPLRVLRLAHWIRQYSPHIIQTWMYHADLIGGLAAKLAGGIPIVWNIRHTNLDPRANKQRTIWIAKICACLSHWLPTRVVCCAEASRLVHKELGYAADKMIVIPNGIDLTIFTPNPVARLAVRRELGIPESTPLIGLVARFHPQKDHHNFVQAAAMLHARLPDVHFLLCGDGVTWENKELAGWIEAAGIRDCFHLLGRREDIPRLNAALDIASSSSIGEGFSNAICEAMACGVPCVVTDVGDSAYIVGDTGYVVLPTAPQSLAAAWAELLTLPQEARCRLGKQARRRVAEKFSLTNVVKQYEILYEEILGDSL